MNTHFPVETFSGNIPILLLYLVFFLLYIQKIPLINQDETFLYINKNVKIFLEDLQFCIDLLYIDTILV